ncbi:MAG: hypothetical protein ACREJ4_07800, partial [Candidatus Methylomirabilaceae bacterium]
MALTPAESGKTFTREDGMQRLVSKLSPAELRLRTIDRDSLRRQSFNARERNVLFVNTRGRSQRAAGSPRSGRSWCSS